MNKALYLSIRRWHFFAGLFVVPFILMLSLTGLVMVAGPWTDAYQYGDELTMVNERSSANGFDSLDSVFRSSIESYENPSFFK